MKRLKFLLLIIVVLLFQKKNIIEAGQCSANKCNDKGCDVSANLCVVAGTNTGTCCCFLGFSGATCNIGSYSK
jgi:hypothetical protein